MKTDNTRNDPIVEEVRKHRREIEKESNDDFTQIFYNAKTRESQMKNRLVSEPIEKGFGDYTIEREALQDRYTVQSLVDEIMNEKK